MPTRRRILEAVAGAGLALVSGCAQVEERHGPTHPADDGPTHPLDLAEQRLREGRASILVRDAVLAYLDAAGTASGVLLGDPAGGGTDLERASRIHNEALERLLRVTRGPRRSFDQTWIRDLARHGAKLDVVAEGEVWAPGLFDRVEFVSSHSSRPLRHVFDQQGLGVPMFSVQKRRADDPRRLQIPDRFYPPLRVYPITVFLRSTGVGRRNYVLEIRDPARADRVSTPSGSLPLAMDLSTPLAYHFDWSRLPLREKLMMLDPDYLEWSAGLHLLHPYEPGKIPVILIHGYWSSATCWLQTLNELRGDPMIRERYQFLIYHYPSINSYLHSAVLLRRSIRLARATFDPRHVDPAFDRMVVVGHSLGGILAKILVQDTGDRLWSLVSHRPLSEINLTDQQREILAEVFFVRPEPEVRRVVFISTPHRGSRFSTRTMGRIAARLTPHPGPLAEVYDQITRANPAEVFSPLFRDEGLATSFDQLREGEPVLEVLSQTPFAPGVASHSIIARQGRGPIEQSWDGVVSYESSHVDTTDSELIVPHHHFAQQEPETIAELKRILTEHLRLIA
jgi:pimeloyl-ACP methyl ester carboxylesterase